MPRAMLRRAMGLMAVLGLPTGCGGTTGEAVQPCAKVGQQCRLAKGGLGVCVRDAADQARFVCTAQH